MFILISITFYKDRAPKCNISISSANSLPNAVSVMLLEGTWLVVCETQETTQMLAVAKRVKELNKENGSF